MNTPAAPAAVAASLEIFQRIPLTQITASPTNPRKHFDKASLEDLTKNVAKLGVLEPVLVRPKAGGYQLVAGERRFRAAKGAKLEAIPAMVRDLTDLEVLEIQIVENLQREGLHELEEAEGYERLMKEHKLTADQIAEKIGRSRRYVFNRLKLCDMVKETRALFYEGKLNATTAMLVARIPQPDLQVRAAKEICGTKTRDGMSVREAVDHVHDNYMLALKGAPFPCDDATLLPAAGTCAACPKRTGNQTDLFGDVQSADTCTDPKCFGAKREANNQRLRTRAAQSGQTFIDGAAAKKIKTYRYSDSLSEGYIALDDHVWAGDKRVSVRALLGKEPKGVVLMQDPYDDTVREIIKHDAVNAAMKEKGIKTDDRGGRSSGGDSYRKQQAAAQRKALLETTIRCDILTAIMAKVDGKMDGDTLRLIAAGMDARMLHDSDQRLEKLLDLGKKKRAAIYAGKDDKAVVRTMVAMALINDVHYGQYDRNPCKDLLDAAKRLKVNATAIRAAREAKAKEKKAEKTAAARKKAPAKKKPVAKK